MGAKAQRIDALERDLASLRGEFAAVGAALDCAFQAGRAFETRRPGVTAASPRTRHLRLIPGEQDARAAGAAAELKAGA